MAQRQIFDELFGLHQQNNIDNDNNNNDDYFHYSNDVLNSTLIYRAFLQELLRISCVVSRGIDHFNTGKELILNTKKEESFDGNDHAYVIPANSLIMYNTEYIHTMGKKENWVSNGSELCLDNWFDVDANGQKIFSTKNRPLFTFGVGKRDCVGRQLAEKEIQLLLGYLILNFEFSFYDKQYAANPSNVDIKKWRSLTSQVKPEIGVLVDKRKKFVP